MKCSCHSHDGFLTVRGYEDAQRRLKLPEVDATAAKLYLDLGVSVSGVRRDEDPYVMCDQQIEEQHRRFLNGS